MKKNQIKSRLQLLKEAANRNMLKLKSGKATDIQGKRKIGVFLERVNIDLLKLKLLLCCQNLQNVRSVLEELEVLLAPHMNMNKTSVTT